jgi:hypothetical protein
MEIRLLNERRAIEKEAAPIHEEEDDPPEPSIVPDPTIAAPAEQPEPKRPMADSASQPHSVIDWQELAKKAAQDVVAQESAENSHRAEMWGRTHSVMFAPPPNSLIADRPYLPDLPFNDQRFKGIEFRIGQSCYFGIPASAPEEVDSDASDSLTLGRQRTGSRLIHCDF